MKQLDIEILNKMQKIVDSNLSNTDKKFKLRDLLQDAFEQWAE